ncbi:MAG TPA: hypothetical protein VN709_04610 [Terriglobales bacterium]|nr:hypothetical protein [Terriglobales bacterium]
MASASPARAAAPAATHAEQLPRWHPATRVAFRFCVLYFGLYIFLTQMLTSLLLATTNDAGAFEVDMTAPVKAIVAWVAAHVFRIAHPLVMRETGSGDRQYDWILVAIMLFLAVAGTIVWSVLDRRRLSYPTLHKWFRLVARFALGATLLTYGAAKIIPLQMPFPDLSRLVEPYGNLSPMGVLWAAIGAAPAYEIFAGCAEFLGGMLVFLPRTATLGALICLADGVQIFMLNMTYDVPVKLLAFHIIPLSLFIIAPDAKRLANVLLFNRPAPVSTEQPLFRSARNNRLALAGQVAAGVFLITANLYGSVSNYNTFGPGRPHSPLYGIWTVESFTSDGIVHPPLLTDTTRWRRLIFDHPGSMILQGMDEVGHLYSASINMRAHDFELTRADNKNSKADFNFTQLPGNVMLLEGSFDGHHIVARLRQVDRSKMNLVNRGFHWIQDVPYNR